MYFILEPALLKILNKIESEIQIGWTLLKCEVFSKPQEKTMDPQLRQLQPWDGFHGLTKGVQGRHISPTHTGEGKPFPDTDRILPQFFFLYNFSVVSSRA